MTTTTLTRRMILGAAFVMMLGGTAGLAAQSPLAPAHPLTVMTFNIRMGVAPDGENHWEKRREQLFAMLRTEAPDIVGLQEAMRFQIDELLVALPGYAFVGVGRTDGKAAGEYSAILYRTARLQPRRSETFWLSDTPTVIRSTTWGNRIERICTWAYFEDAAGVPFYVYNAHLDHESQPAREKSVALMLASIAARTPAAPVIVTGDLNAGEQNAASRAMMAVLRDSYRVVHPDATEVGTFNGFNPTQTTGDKIDYIFVDASAEVITSDILRCAANGRCPSDHFPIRATIRLR